MARPTQLDAVLGELDGRVRAALASAGLPIEEAAFERPKQAEHGDWATSIALRLAKSARMAPRQVAERLVEHLELPDGVAAVEIAGPGFVNFRFASSYWNALVPAIVASGEDYGCRLPGEDAEVVNVEFVSANPTGPLHAGAGRWAATGDAIAELLAADGNTVVREYYVNDAGEQIRVFGETVLRVAQGALLEEHHYQGEYVGDLVAALRDEHGAEVFTRSDDVIGALAVEQMRTLIEGTLHQLGVDYDVWFSERLELHDSGAIESTIEFLTAAGRTYLEDGALFLRTEQFGDDKDRVLVRGDGRPTYFAADCAYLRSKWARADRLFYLLGADHHGYVGRIKSAAQCLDIPADAVEIRIGQLVNLLRDGTPVRMSKRAGQYVTLDEVVEEVGVDVCRYSYLRQSLDTAMDFDLAVVTQQSMENPVYYVQYAHARITTLLRNADESGFDPGDVAEADGDLLIEPAEIELRRKLAGLPEAIAEAAEARATQRLTRYVEELAGLFHRFYAECRVLVEDQELARARYWLAYAARIVLANALGILRVSAPERM